MQITKKTKCICQCGNEHMAIEYLDTPEGKQEELTCESCGKDQPLGTFSPGCKWCLFCCECAKCSELPF